MDVRSCGGIRAVRVCSQGCVNGLGGVAVSGCSQGCVNGLGAGVGKSGGGLDIWFVDAIAIEFGIHPSRRKPMPFHASVFVVKISRDVNIL